jgi:hypothetical protein
MKSQACLGIAFAAGLAGFAGSARADADGLNDNLGPRELGTGEARRAEATGGLATTMNPAGLPLTRELVFEGGYGYRPEDGASVVAVSACDSTNAAPGCFYYHYVTASPGEGDMELSHRAHTVGSTVSRMIAPRVILGLGGKYFDYNSEVMDEGDSSGFTFDAGALIRATNSVNLAVVGYNLVGEDSPHFPMAIAAGASVRPSPSLGISFDALWNLDLPDDATTGRYGGGLEYFFRSGDGQTGYPIRAGALYDAPGEATYVTAGLGLASVKLGVDLGARLQVAGEGDELMIVGSLRFFGPRMGADDASMMAR